MSMAAAMYEPQGLAQMQMIRAGAITASILIHGLLFVGYGGSISAPSSESVNTSVTRLSFLAPAPVPDAVPDQPQEKPEPKKVVAKKEKVVKRAEAVREVAEVEPEPVESKPDAQPMQQAAAPSEAVPQINEGIVQRETERYLSNVMAHIEQHKWYPKAARRRGIEGEVHVRFTLHPDGSARELTVENGSSVLLIAARKAVEKAMPMPKPPENIHCPLECEFRMRFSLNAT
jgi:periplasmic protein TonB